MIFLRFLTRSTYWSTLVERVFSVSCDFTSGKDITSLKIWSSMSSWKWTRNFMTCEDVMCVLRFDSYGLQYISDKFNDNDWQLKRPSELYSHSLSTQLLLSTNDNTLTWYFWCYLENMKLKLLKLKNNETKTEKNNWNWSSKEIKLKLELNNQNWNYTAEYVLAKTLSCIKFHHSIMHY